MSGAGARRITVGVLAGGASAERQISLATGAWIAQNLPADRFDVVLLDPLALMSANPALDAVQRRQALALLADAGPEEDLQDRDRELPADFQAQMIEAAAGLHPATRPLFGATGGGPGIDVALIALHGPWGEDGRIQGLLETLGIPHTGSGVLASALAMDKVMAKRVLAAAGLAVPRGEVVTRRQLAADPVAAIGRAGSVGVPAIVKPAMQGSSIGMTLVQGAALLGAAIEEAHRYDDRALVEERVAGTELTCGVIGNDEPVALPLVEIVPKRAFFDYRAKYDPASSDEICPARVPAPVASAVQRAALRAHEALGCRGISRTDVIWDGTQAVVLEVNTMPGMTANSLLPKAARAAGIPFPELLARLVAWALEDRSSA
ncbi:MAG: D-alanine--D-alanine ligase [Candidatus Limnocylindria bacterium]